MRVEWLWQKGLGSYAVVLCRYGGCPAHPCLVSEATVAGRRHYWRLRDVPTHRVSVGTGTGPATIRRDHVPLDRLYHRCIQTQRCRYTLIETGQTLLI